MTKTNSNCADNNCPIHHGLKTHGRLFRGTVIEAKSGKTATVLWQRKAFLPKYDRYETRRTTMHAHNPECISAKKGDIVALSECKPISKTKHFVITEKIGSD